MKRKYNNFKVGDYISYKGDRGYIAHIVTEHGPIMELEKHQQTAIHRPSALPKDYKSIASGTYWWPDWEDIELCEPQIEIIVLEN